MNDNLEQQVKEYDEAAKTMADRWVAAAGGLEVWTTARSGRRYLYVFNFATQEHGWLNESDIVEMESPYNI